MSRHKTCYVISYHGILCHNMSYVTTITASLVWSTPIDGTEISCEREPGNPRDTSAIVTTHAASLSQIC